MLLLLFLVLVCTLALGLAVFFRSRGGGSSVGSMPDAVDDNAKEAIHAYAISLPDQTDRRNALVKNFSSQGIRIRFFNAVDTRGDRWKRYRHHITEKGQRALEWTVRTGKRRDHAELTPGAVGCFLSQLALWEKLLSETDRVSLVLEDDSMPMVSFRSELRSILQAFPQDADLFLLNYQTFGGQIPVTRIPYACFLLPRSARFYMMNCYLISVRGIQKILDYYRHIHHSRFEVQIDSFLTDMNQKGLLRIYCSDRQLCPQSAFPATIQGFDVVS